MLFDKWLTYYDSIINGGKIKRKLAKLPACEQ